MTTIDIFELSRARKTVSGDLELKDFPELASLLEGEGRDARIHYEATGTAGRDGKPGADLSLKGVMRTRCVLCGEPCEVQIDKTVPFLFTRTEAEADAMDIADDGEYEIVVGSKKFDVNFWVEEELMLSLPSFPQHDDCEPDRSKLSTKEMAGEETSQKANPFAVLASLKKSG
ncbi:MAG: DUF177 domain-containing protein [Duodenibacillus sp.]|nr:DUF177 domain-containing protein [Duodenibacillus sp.]